MAQSHVALRAVFGRRVQSGGGQDRRVSGSPSPQPSPRGEGDRFTCALVIRLSLVVVCRRNEGPRSGDCNRSVRIFQCRANALPLLGERAGVRGNEANSNPRRTTTPGGVKFREYPGRAGSFPICL